MALRVASAHANKIRANGRRMPSSDHSTPNTPSSGPGQTRFHFHYTHPSPFSRSQSCQIVGRVFHGGVLPFLSLLITIEEEEMLFIGIQMEDQV